METKVKKNMNQKSEKNAGKTDPRFILFSTEWAVDALGLTEPVTVPGVLASRKV